MRGSCMRNKNSNTSNHGLDAHGTVRRSILKFAGTLPVAPALVSLLSETAYAGSTKQVAGFDPSLVPSKATLKSWEQQLHDFGPIRATGTKQARAFEEWLAAEFGKLGLTVERDQFRLTSWECSLKDCSVVVSEKDKKRDLEVIAYYP